MKTIICLAGVLPGLGHFLRGRYLAGAVFMFFFLNALNAFFIGAFLWEKSGRDFIKYGGLAAAALAWAMSFVFNVSEVCAKQRKTADESQSAKIALKKEAADGEEKK